MPPDQRATVGRATGGTVSLTVEQDEVGKAQTITAPSRGKPISELLAKLPGVPGLAR